jgi:hypothetical protein
LVLIGWGRVDPLPAIHMLERRTIADIQIGD